ncbi:MAG: hypothetical protein AAGM67_20595, partial [Bacteroidota bacterium]
MRTDLNTCDYHEDFLDKSALQACHRVVVDLLLFTRLFPDLSSLLKVRVWTRLKVIREEQVHIILRAEFCKIAEELDHNCVPLHNGPNLRSQSLQQDFLSSAAASGEI